MTPTPDKTYATRPRVCRVTFLRSLLVLVFVVVLPNSVAQSQPSSTATDREATLKAAYIYKFIKYVKWPAESFDQSDSPLVIGVVGESPVSSVLRVIIRSKSKSSARPLQFAKVNTVAEARACHILFFSKDAADSSLIGKLKEAPVFLVGETDTFLEEGGMMEFQLSNNKIRLRLAMTTVKRHELTVHSQLARISEIVAMAASSNSAAVTRSP